MTAPTVTERRQPVVEQRATPAPATSGARPRLLTPLLVSLLAGLFVLSLVVAAGAAYVAERPASWNATSSFAVFPRTGDPGSEASYYETLSRGQIVTTMAQVVAAQQRAPGAELTVEVVPETSLVTLTATAPTRQEAELLAARGLRSALTALDALQLPFAPRVVDAGTGTGVRAASGAPKLLAVVVLVALVLALTVQQGIAALGRRPA